MWKDFLGEKYEEVKRITLGRGRGVTFDFLSPLDISITTSRSLFYNIPLPLAPEKHCGIPRFKTNWSIYKILYGQYNDVVIPVSNDEYYYY